MAEQFNFVVNGAPCAVTAAPDTPLLHILRNDLQLKGTRFGGVGGACGSCPVTIDGRAMQSCDTPLWSVQDCEVVTVEGLGTPAAPHPVQQAFIDEQAAQCGYCINGIMMSMAALDRHLCRCGTHLRILRAARKAVQLTAAAS